MQRILFIIIFLLASHRSYAIDIELELNQSIIYLTGAKIQLVLSVSHKRKELEFVKIKSDVSLPPDQFYKRILKTRHPNKKIDIEHISYSEDKKFVDKNGYVIESNIFTYEFQLFEIESVEISPVKFQFTNLTNDNQICYSPYAYIHPLPPESRGISSLAFKDISTEKEVKKDINKFYYIIIGIFTFILIFLLGLRFLNWRTIHFDQFGKASTQAQNKMNRLEKNEALESPDFFVKLTRILKHYIERKWDIVTLSENTNDFIIELKNKEKSDQLILLIENFFRDCDEIKFAPNRTQQINKRDFLDRGYTLIDQIEKERAYR